MKRASRQSAGGVDSRFDPGIEGTIQPGNTNDRGDFTFTNGPDQLRAAEGGRQNQRQAQRQRRQHPHHKGIDVMQWQGQENPILASNEFRFFKAA
jgi:hypothetical protein